MSNTSDNEFNNLYNMLESFLDDKYSNKRLEMSEVFLILTKVLSYRSSCSKAKQAAIIVQNNKIISIGYNGPPAKTINCNEHENGESICGKDSSGSCLLGIHAEQNAIGYLTRSGQLINNATLYVTQSPCISCAKLIASTNINEVIYINEYRLNEGILFLNKVGISTTKYILTQAKEKFLWLKQLLVICYLIQQN